MSDSRAEKRIDSLFLKKTYNVENALDGTIDWSTHQMPLFVKSNFVYSFPEMLDLDRICDQLTGKIS